MSDKWQTEYMFLYTASAYEGEIGECNEGTLEWIDKEKVYDLPLWEGDKIFFRLLEEQRPHFSLKLRYVGEALVEAVLDGKNILE
jgi:8-oxo-dGTP diphosphatase